MYNIHPIFVHFPIALLFAYSIIKILPFKKWFPTFAWRDIERVFLAIGVLGAFAALATGDTAEHLIHPNHQLVEMHSTFGALSTWIYGALLLGEIAAYVRERKYSWATNSSVISKFISLLEQVLCNRVFSIILALAGFVAISITGMLGGVLAYGTTADPLSPMLLKILGLTNV